MIYLGKNGLLLKSKGENVLVDVEDKNELKYKSRVVIYTKGSFDGSDLKDEPERVNIRGAGEYEVGGMGIIGVSGGEDRTVYRLEIDGVVVGILGDFTQPLSDKKVERLEGIDILVVSVNQNMKLMLSWAKKWGVNYLIPVGYEEGDGKLKAFLDLVDREDLEAVPNLKVDKTNLPEGMEVVVLCP